MGKLDETHEFLDLFMHHIGQSEVPRQFYWWAAMSLLAASVADRVWIEPDVGRRIYPNLYVFLIGPSGSGKEQAVIAAARLGLHESALALFMGRGTRQFLLDYLSRGGELEEGVRIADKPKLYMVTEELGSAIRPGDLGHELITFMTECYTHKPWTSDGTRMTGLVTLREPCFNWLAGTTDEWLIRAVDRDAIEGGFFARVISTRGDRDYLHRYPKMLYPDDREEVIDHLKWRVSQYTLLTGKFVYAPETDALHDTWYRERTAPLDRAEMPAFNRADEMIYRLSLLLKLSSIEEVISDEGIPWSIERQIEPQHFTEAVQLWDGLAVDMPETIRKASATERTEGVDVVADIMARFGQLDHSTLLKRVGNHGMDKDSLRSAVETLKERGEVEELPIQPTGGRPRRTYKWTGGS